MTKNNTDTRKNNTNTNAHTSLACARGLQNPKKAIKNIISHADVSEKMIERYLTEQIKKRGWWCLKYDNPNMVGFPDRLIVLSKGGVVWVELKSKGRKPTKIQQIRIAGLTNMGHIVKVIDNKPDVDELIKVLEQCYTDHTNINKQQ